VGTDRDERGFVLIYLALCLTVFMAMAGFALDVGNWYYVAQRQQKAADSAALAGVIYLPQSVTAGNPSYDRALTAANENGYPSGVSVSAVAGNPTQLKVSVTQTVNNTFAALVGYNTQTITRSAIAEYEAPVSMGSPDNAFGTEPSGGNEPASWGAVAAFQPHMWAMLEGPTEYKDNGDAVQPTVCSSSSYDGCSASPQTNYDPNGYYYRVTVNSSGHAGQVLAIEAFDPTFADTGQTCSNSNFTGSNAATGISNPYTTENGTKPSDASTRYNPGATGSTLQWCTGDSDYRGNGPLTTTFVVRQDLNPFSPASNPVVGTGGCAGEQFGYWPSSTNMKSALDQTNGGYSDQLARSFRQWVPICVFDPTQYPAGDYLVQIRSNVAPTKFQSTMQGGATSPLPTTSGSNNFALRAGWISSASAPTFTPYSANPKYPSVDPGQQYAGGYPTLPRPPLASNSNVTIAATQAMGLYANAPAGTNPNFYMARVLPGASGQALDISLWDIGDCSGCSNVTLSFLKPDGTTPTCQITLHQGPTDAPGSGTVLQPAGSACNYTTVNPAQTNGRWLDIQIAMPTGYTCVQSNPQDCWFTMRYTVNGGALNDNTTWMARLLGNPVRLVQ